MIIYQEGGLVKSLAGHDKGQYFIILAECGEYVSLVDGKFRKLENPKRKNKKHIQLINLTDETLSRKLAAGETVMDEEVWKIIRCYERNHRAI